MIVCLGSFTPANATDLDHLRFRNIGTDDGLSNGTVFCILEDSRGFRWFGTRRELNRWDGRSMKVYYQDPTTEDGLPGGRISSLIETPDGKIWIGTFDSGLASFDPRTETFKPYRTSNDPGALSDDRVTCFELDANGHLWIGTRNGFNRYIKKEDRFETFNLGEHSESEYSRNWVTALYADSKGRLWIGDKANGLSWLDLGTKKIKHSKIPSLSVDNVGTAYITAICEDEVTGKLWMSAFVWGVLHYDPEEETLEHHGTQVIDPHVVNKNAIYDMTLGEDGSLWLATVMGLTHYDPLERRYQFFEPNPRSSTSITGEMLWTVYRDSQGLIWTGADGRGVDVCNPKQNRFEHYHTHQEGGGLLVADKIYGVELDREGRLWLASLPGGFHRIDLTTNTTELFQTDDSDPYGWSMNYASKVLVDHADRVWMGVFEAGLFRLDPGEKEPRHYRHVPDRDGGLSNNSIYAICQGTDSSLWFGTDGGGLNLYREATDDFQFLRHDRNDSTSLISDRIFSLLYDHEGCLWVGTPDAGLGRLETDRNEFSHYQPSSDPNSIPSNTVLCLFEDDDKTIWIGTRPGGLSRIDSNRIHFERIDLGNDPRKTVVYAIEEDDHGNLWMSSSLGIIKYHRNEGVIARYTKEDGVQGTDFNYSASTKDEQGFIYFGGIKGLNRFHPDSIRINQHLPPVFLSQLWINHEPVTVGQMVNDRVILERDLFYLDTLRLSYRDKVLKFEFVALDYANPQLNQYRYRLLGFDDTWIDAGNDNTVTFTNLNPGWYELELAGSNNDRVWNENGQSLSIFIKPPFWATTLFRSSMVLSLAILIATIQWVRTYRLRLQNRKLEALVRERTAELQTEMEARQSVEREKNRMQIEHLRKELLTKSLNLHEKEQVMDTLQHDLESVLNQKDSSTSRIAKLVRFLKDRKMVNQEWEEFERWFTNVHSGFYETLKGEYPDLSGTELKVCALLRLNLLSKEIARILNVQPSSVDIYRHRIRSKLNLSKEDNLTSYLYKY